MDIENLFKKHYGRLCNTAFQIVNDTDIAEDLVQELFISLWQKKETIAITSSVDGYLTRSVINTCLNYIEKHKKIQFLEYDKMMHTVSTVDRADQQMNYEELRKAIYAALEKLPPKCKTIFVLSRFEDMKYKEIAGMLDISVKTVENQVGIAIDKLKQELKQSLGSDYRVYSLALLLLGISIINDACI